MYCMKCGKEIPDDARFCPHCGATTASVAPEHRVHVAAARIDPSTTAPMPKIALPVEKATVPTAYAPEPADTPTPARKNRTATIAVVAVAAAVLVGVGAVAVFGGFSSQKNDSAAVQAADGGSTDADNHDNEAVTLPSQDERPVEGVDVQEADDAADADPLAGSADAAASLDQTHTYSNARFGFTAQVPNRFKVTKVSANNDGLEYTDPATGIMIAVSGALNAGGQSAQQLLAGTDLAGMQDVYTASDNGWYVASWRDGDSIVYEKTLVTDSATCTMRFEYAYGMRDTGSGLVEALSPTLAFTGDGE